MKEWEGKNNRSKREGENINHCEKIKKRERGGEDSHGVEREEEIK